jgi:hypothetical protein
MDMGAKRSDVGRKLVNYPMALGQQVIAFPSSSKAAREGGL